MNQAGEGERNGEVTGRPNGGDSEGHAAQRPAAEAGEPSCDPALLALLVCPYTKTSLGYDAETRELISRPERLAYPIRDGIPILIREEARSLDASRPRT